MPVDYTLVQYAHTNVLAVSEAAGGTSGRQERFDGDVSALGQMRCCASLDQNPRQKDLTVLHGFGPRL
jgi:hypothetical protein